MIDTSGFIKRILQTKNIAPKLANALQEGISLNRFEVQETFLSPGHHACGLYFVQSGLIRGSVEGAAGKITTWFKEEGDLFIPQGLFTQQVCQEYINAVTRTSLLTLPFRHIQRLVSAYPEMAELVIMLISENALLGQEREYFLRKSSAKDRYDSLLKKSPNLFKRVPHFVLASYLNVTKETFSRLNKGLPY